MAGESALKHKVGPLPTWGWLAIATGAGGAYYLYERNKASTASTASMATSAAPPDTVLQITNQMPPEAPAPHRKGHPQPPRHHHKPPHKHPKPPHKHPEAYGPVRRVSTGTQSLAEVAKQRHTTVAHLIAVTKTSKEISPANLKKFLAAAGHPNEKLPKGLVYFTSH